MKTDRRGMKKEGVYAIRLLDCRRKSCTSAYFQIPDKCIKGM